MLNKQSSDLKVALKMFNDPKYAYKQISIMLNLPCRFSQTRMPMPFDFMGEM